MNNIYISYAWKDNKSELGKQREEMVDKICNQLKENKYKIIRDKHHLTLGSSIEDFMKEIGRGNYVIVVISDKYLRSEYCMFEAIELLNYKDYSQKIFPIVLGDANIYSKENIFEYVSYWRQQKQKMEELIDSTIDAQNDDSLISMALKIMEISDKVDDFIVYIKDKLSINPFENYDGFMKMLTDNIRKDALKLKDTKSILIAGLGSINLPEEIYWISKYLGQRLAEENYNLIAGGWDGVDYVVCEEYAKVLSENKISLSSKLTQIVPENVYPKFRGGNVVQVKSGIEEWLAGLKRADVVVLVGGSGGTYETYQYALQEAVPVVPIVCTNGDAKRVFDEMLINWEKQSLPGISLNQFKSLNQFINTEQTSALVIDDVIEIIDEIITHREIFQ